MPTCIAINPTELKNIIDDPNTIIIDVRETDEYNRERIHSAECMPLSSFDISKFNDIADKKIIIHCQSGNRTRNYQTVFENLPNKEVYILEGGITAWKNSGGKTITNTKAPLPIMRQVQIIVGFMVVLGVILGATVSPWWTLLSAFFGAGLLFAGLTGTCGLASALALLPYNKK